MARLRSCFHSVQCTKVHLKFLHCNGKKKPRFSYFSWQVCDLMEPPPAWALHGIVKIGRHGHRSDEWHNDQLGDIQKFRELRNSRCQRLGGWWKMENRRCLICFYDFCVHAPSVPSCCRWLCQLPERADASVEPTSIGPGGNLLSTATPCCFTMLHSSSLDCMQLTTNGTFLWIEVSTRRGLGSDVTYVTLSVRYLTIVGSGRGRVKDCKLVHELPRNVQQIVRTS